MQHYAVFDAAGLPAGFYDDGAYPAAPDGTRNSAIPAGAVAITQAQHAELMDNQGRRRWDGAALQPYEPPPPPAPPRVQLGGTFLGAVADLGWWAWFDQGGAAQASAGKPLDQRYWTTIGKADTVLATDAKLARVARAAEAARVAASGQPAPAAPVITIAAAMDRGDAMAASATAQPKAG